MHEPISPPRSKRRRSDASDSDIKQDPPFKQSNLQIYSWNVNGIAPFIQPSITSFFKSKSDSPEPEQTVQASLRGFLRRHDWPTILLLQEVKINPDDTATIGAVKRAVRKQPDDGADETDYEAYLCLPSDKYNARGFGRKVYGVCTIVRKDWADTRVEKIRPVSWDAEGRFLVIETKTSEGTPKLAIINVYAVNGTDNPYKDSLTGEVIGTRHDRKLQVHALLQKECRGLEADGFEVIVAGDLNIARHRIDGFPNLRIFPHQHCINRADFEEKFLSQEPSVEQSSSMRGLGMIDSFRHLHPNREGYTFYPRTRTFGASCDRVDLILCSRTLESNLVEASMLETPGERGPSDHVPLYANFNLPILSELTTSRGDDG